MATVKVTLESIVADGDLEGYSIGYADPVDREVAWEADCSYCKRHGTVCVAYRSRNPRSYRAFMECPSCGHAEEF